MSTIGDKDFMELVEGTAGHRCWIDAARGWVHCPHDKLHKSPVQPGDCVVVNHHGTPQFYCIDPGCRSELARMNAGIVQIINDNKKGEEALAEKEGTSDYGARMKRLAQKKLRARVSGVRQRILNENRWSESDLSADSLPLTAPNQTWRHVVDLFSDGDLIWCGSDGDVHSSSGGCFRTKEEWLTKESSPGALICPSAFAPGATNRCDDSVVRCRYGIVSSAKLNREEILAVFKWLRGYFPLGLYAIVEDSAGSLYGWFRHTVTCDVEALDIILSVFDCTSSFASPSHPVPLPGNHSNGKPQTLIYLKGN